MPNESYREDWKRCGDHNPYYGVLSDERFRRSQFTEEARKKFFLSGEEHVDRIIEKIRLHVDRDFRPNRTLDFGCGVGRLVIPFAKLSQQVVGIDISDGMLAEATTNCGLAGLSNVSFFNSLEQTSGPFDFVHSYIVLQHIPQASGARILKELCEKVEEGGIIAIHLIYFNQGPLIRRTVSRLRAKSRLLHRALNLFQNKALNEPLLQMNEYSLDQVMLTFQRNHFSDLHIFFTLHAISRGMMVIGKKSHGSCEF